MWLAKIFASIRSTFCVLHLEYFGYDSGIGLRNTEYLEDTMVRVILFAWPSRIYPVTEYKQKVKVKQSRRRPGVAQRVPGN